VQPGDTLTYTLTVHNAGAGAATLVSVTDMLPAEVSYVSCAGATCSEASGTVTWSLASLNAGATATLTLVVQVKPATLVGAVVANTTYSVDSLETNAVSGSPVYSRVTYALLFPLIFR
jgi:uncharacterized repeat protein (TIGR01451 family)